MVPLRIDVSDARPAYADTITQPRLVLKEWTSETSPRRRARHSPLRRLESVLAIAAFVAVLLYFVIGFAVSLFHAIQQSYVPATAPSVIMISKTVMPGDTLSQFASRYGDPDAYILDREEQIARVNHLSGTAPLFPGQHLRIPVTSPTVIARIEQNYHHARLASR